MSEIWTTVVGNIAGAINKRRLADGTELASFRVASNERRLDRTSGTWVTAGTSYVTVTAWRRLGQHVLATFVKGDPVLVYGRLSTREYEDRAGQVRTDIAIDAQAVGPDLTWCTAAVTRIRGRSGETPADSRTDDVVTTGVDEYLPGDQRDSAGEAEGEDGAGRNGCLVGAVPGEGA